MFSSHVEPRPGNPNVSRCSRFGWHALALLILAHSAPAQSIIFPTFFDRHYVHLATKPVVSLGAYAVLRLVKLPKTPSTVLAILGPSLVSDIVWEFKDPGHFTDGVTVKDTFADSWAASLSMILLRLHGWKRIAAVLIWATVEFPFGLNRDARP